MWWQVETNCQVIYHANVRRFTTTNTHTHIYKQINSYTNISVWRQLKQVYFYAHIHIYTPGLSTLPKNTYYITERVQGVIIIIIYPSFFYFWDFFHKHDFYIFSLAKSAFSCQLSIQYFFFFFWFWINIIGIENSENLEKSEKLSWDVVR